jgi:hypothetical protein
MEPTISSEQWRQFIASHICRETPSAHLQIRDATSTLFGFRHHRHRYLAFVNQITGTNRRSRLQQLLLAKYRTTRWRKVLHTRGYQTTAYGIYPSLTNPTVIYQLQAPSASYSERLLFSRATHRPVIGPLLRWVLGFDMSLGAVLVVGSLPLEATT